MNFKYCVVIIFDKHKFVEIKQWIQHKLQKEIKDFKLKDNCKKCNYIYPKTYAILFFNIEIHMRNINEAEFIYFILALSGLCNLY